MSRLRRSLRRRRNQSGYTLIETMVAMMLLSVVMAAAFGVLAVMQRGAMTTTNRFTAEGEAQTIADRRYQGYLALAQQGENKAG